MFITGGFCTGHSHRKNTGFPVPPEKIRAVYGVIKDVKEKGTLLYVTIENATVSEGKNWFEVYNKVITFLPEEARIYVSDWIYLYEIKNVKRINENVLISARYWKVEQPFSPLNNFIKNVRLRTEKLVEKWFRYHPQEAAIFQMMVLGDKRQSLEIKQVFIQTGTYHLLIVSGIHLGYLILFLRIIFFPLRRFEQAYYKVFNFIYLIAIAIYSAITGFSTPVVRAALMFGLYLFAEIIERPNSSIDSIGWAAFLILFFKPDELFNMGFQLSFAATSGIILTMRNIPQIKEMPSWLDSTIRAVAGAQIFTMPVLAANTGNFYPAGFISNPILVPIGGLAVFLGLSFLIFGFLRHIIIFPLIKMLDIFWISTKMFSTISPQISWAPDIPFVLAIYSIIFLILFRNRWKMFVTLFVSSLLIQLFLPTKHDEGKTLINTRPNEQACVVIFPCKKLLCAIEKKNRIVLIISEKENPETLEPVMEEIKKKNKDTIIFFTGVPHDTISQLETILKYVKPTCIVDNPSIKKNPTFGYRKCFFLADTGIKQKFWKFLEPHEGIRVVYNLKDTYAIEYKTEKGTIIIANYMNSKIFEVLPFSPSYYAIYATNLALSKRLAVYLQEYQTGQVLYQKIIYNPIEEPFSFKLMCVDTQYVIK
ncbi:MAG: ComEC/Rec2 family competence protein [bacterium]|nr:ComEC/Rec2 family competence protein [bacterium]